jgi:hypothetical protein
MVGAPTFLGLCSGQCLDWPAEMVADRNGGQSTNVFLRSGREELALADGPLAHFR